MAIEEKERDYWQRQSRSDARMRQKRLESTRIYRIPIQIDSPTTPDNYYLIATQPSIPLNGVTYIPNFLSADEQKMALDLVDGEIWETFIARRQQYWGHVYYHTTSDISAIQPTLNDEPSDTTSPINHDIKNNQKDDDDQPDEPPTIANSLAFKEMRWIVDKCYQPLIYDLVHPTPAGFYFYKGQKLVYDESPAGIFSDHPLWNADQLDTRPDSETDAPTQVLVNEYRLVQGISRHIDDPFAFGRVIALVSLHMPIWMYLEHTETKERFDVLLEPGSMLVLKGQARFLWTHAVSKSRWFPVPRSDLSDDKIRPGLVPIEDIELVHRNNDQFRRVSLTIRRLLSGRKQVVVDSHEWVN